MSTRVPHRRAYRLSAKDQSISGFLAAVAAVKRDREERSVGKPIWSLQPPARSKVDLKVNARRRANG